MRLLRLLTAAACAASVAALPVIAAGGPAVAVGTTPQTVPALSSWTAGTGTFTFTSSSRIVVDPAYSTQLSDEAATFADDLTTLAGRTVQVVTGTAATGDIALTLNDPTRPAEGYKMTVGSSLNIQAKTDTGAFYGTRTVLQLLKQSNAIPAGTATDAPLKPERGLMVDQGRQFFTVPWLKQHIKELSYLKLNYFQFHLSDFNGFRLESSSHPEIVSTDHYSKQDIADLVALGQKYKVAIIPEIDMPGHATPLLNPHPDYRLVSDTGTVYNSNIDLSKAGARTLIKDLISEYASLFPAPYFHIGADEYMGGNLSSFQNTLGAYARATYGSNATPKDAYYGFINEVDDLLVSKGKTTRMWSDGIGSGDGIVPLHTRIIAEYWDFLGQTPQVLVNAGFTVANQSRNIGYYTNGDSNEKPDPQWMYETWTPDTYQSNQTITNAAKNPGTLLHVWCDAANMQNENAIAQGIAIPLRTLAQKTWGSPRLTTTYADFVPIMTAVGHNPAWPGAADIARNRTTTASSQWNATDRAAVLATDGDPGTRWSSLYNTPTIPADDLQWIRVDLGSVQSIGRVVLRWETAYGKAYKIQVSDDATTWRDVYSTTSGTGGTLDLTGLGASGRYVRMNGTQRGTIWGYSLWSFEVYGGGLSGTHKLTTGAPTADKKALDDPGASSNSGTQLITWSPGIGTNQNWQLTYNSDGTYSLANGSSQMCLDVAGSSKTAGAAVVQATCNASSDSQHWFLKPADGSWTFPNTWTVTNKNSSLLLTTASTSDGAAVTQQTDNGSTLQRWQIG
ncbi:family 20 glycosylhydrolase [Streptomyces sp. NRRL B-24484]|uniref:family 20 glycosylhydrolase n=1 Tax=Streptomyces sp. NRRL B-24484 TaxID=1463833 RepID=UPI000693BA11|nr:family 20 glycosylhydrolase [Streptomyces sp. NRRL B-24484]